MITKKLYPSSMKYCPGCSQEKCLSDFGDVDSDEQIEIANNQNTCIWCRIRIENRITPSMGKAIMSVANKLTNNSADYDDCILEGNFAIASAPENCTESFYIQRASYAMRDFLKRERLHRSRELQILDTLSENTPEQPLLLGKKPTVPNYDTNESEYMSQNDRETEDWLNHGDLY